MGEGEATWPATSVSLISGERDAGVIDAVLTFEDAGPGKKATTIDLDSTIVEVSGKKKHGAAYGYTRVLGYHPLLATRANTGEILHGRLRKGSSQRGTKRFCEELVAPS